MAIQSPEQDALLDLAGDSFDYGGEILDAEIFADPPPSVGFRSLLAKGVSGAGAGSLAYSLATGQGDYSLNGQAAGLVVTRTLAADQGSYALTGQTISLPATRLLLADQGSYMLSGQSATLTYVVGSIGFRSLLAKGVSGAGIAYAAYVLSAGQGAYSLSGQSASLSKSTSATAGFTSLLAKGVGGAGSRPIIYTMAADPGAYSVIGADALVDSQITLAPGSYSLTGQNATLGPSAASATSGFRSLLGKGVSGAGLLNQHYTLAAGQGAYALSGQSVTFSYVHVAGMGYGTYAIDGQGLTLRYSGASAGIGYHSLLARGVGGTGVTPNSYTLPLDYGSYNVLGRDALSDFEITLSPGSYLVNGQATALTYSSHPVLVLGFGSYVLTGQAVTLTTTGTVVIPPSTGGGIGGGGGRHRGWDEAEARRKRKKDQELEASIRRIYRDLTEEPATAELAGEIVEPIAKTTAAVPKVRDVAFERATVEIELALRMLHAEMDALRAEEAEIAEILEILELID